MLLNFSVQFLYIELFYFPVVWNLVVGLVLYRETVSGFREVHGKEKGFTGNGKIINKGT